MLLALCMIQKSLFELDPAGRTSELLCLCQTPLMVISARLSLCGWLMGLWFGCNQKITGCETWLLKKKIIIYECLVLVTSICCHPVLELRALLFSSGARMWQAMVPKRSRAKHTLTTRC